MGTAESCITGSAPEQERCLSCTKIGEQFRARFGTDATLLSEWLDNKTRVAYFCWWQSAPK